MSFKAETSGLRTKELPYMSSAVLEDLHALEDAVSLVGFDHGISNWQVIFIADPERKRRILSSADGGHADVLAVFCVDPEAWMKTHSGLWETASFESRARYIDDMFAIGRGHKTLQRDRAMRSVGMAAGAMLSKAKSLGYSVESLEDVDISAVTRETGLPSSYQVEYVFALGHQSNHSAVGRMVQTGCPCVAREQFSQRLVD